MGVDFVWKYLVMKFHCMIFLKGHIFQTLIRLFSNEPFRNGHTLWTKKKRKKVVPCKLNNLVIFNKTKMIMVIFDFISNSLLYLTVTLELQQWLRNKVDNTHHYSRLVFITRMLSIQDVFPRIVSRFSSVNLFLVHRLRSSIPLAFCSKACCLCICSCCWYSMYSCFCCRSNSIFCSICIRLSMSCSSSCWRSFSRRWARKSFNECLVSSRTPSFLSNPSYFSRGGRGKRTEI